MNLSKKALTDASVVLWILDNNIVTENGKAYLFDHHRFMIDYLNDDHPHKVSCKASQIGETVGEFLDDFHLVGKRGLNVAHTFHTSDVLQSVVRPKVNPLIANNQAIKDMLTVDSEGLKGFGNHFLYLKGANAESQAISFTADVMKFDEKDRSNLSVIEMFESRMDYSETRWIREFSNPSAVGVGVDASWQRSNQFHWFVTCHSCGHEWFIDFEPSSEHNHYVDLQREIYACGNPECNREISDADRIRGRWVAKYADRDNIHGYWFSQMMAPWFSAKRIIQQFETKSVEFFHNFVLGKAYTPADLRFDRNAIMRANHPARLMPRGMVMGSDIGKPHWYWLGNSAGVTEVGRAQSWDDLERIFLENNCDAWVMDAQPEFTQVQKMLRKYPGKAFACYFVEDTKDIGIIRWQNGEKDGFVHADRTKIIDRLVTEVTNEDLLFRGPRSELEVLADHAANMYRVVETDEKGKTVVRWMTVPGKPDHLVFAGVYFRIALEKSFSAGGGVITVDESRTPSGLIVRNGKARVEFDVARSQEEARTR